MSEQDIENLDSQNQAADSDTDTNENTNESAQDSVDVEKLQEQNKKLFERAKKAESEAKELKSKKTEAPVAQVEAKDDLSPKDLYALMDAKVPQGQVDEVIKASKILGKSIPETLKDGFVQARLKDLAEEHQTANATNTGTSKRTSPKLTDDQIVQNFMEGKEVDPEALALARINLRKKNNG